MSFCNSVQIWERNIFRELIYVLVISSGKKYDKIIIFLDLFNGNKHVITEKRIIT